MKKVNKLLAMTLAALSVLGATSSQVGAETKEEIVVVVNKASPARALSRDELRPIFQTTKVQWPDGTKIEAINLPEDNSTRQGFDAAVLGLDPDRVARYWIDRKIRGGERPPRKVSSPAAMLRGVAAEKGAVGYVLSSESNDTVRIAARIRNGQVLAP